MTCDDGLIRCEWCGNDPLYRRYHDEEWGHEVTDDTKMFEFLILEGAQAGLSWLTILRRREAYRAAFADYDAEKVARFGDEEIARLLAPESGIIRNRLKIVSAISNARLFLDVQEEFGSFGTYLRSYLPDGKAIINHWQTIGELPASTALSDKIAADMKRRGFKFFGSTICYSHLQATGLVNDHIVSCAFR
ncbi:MAG: DNA-3-methyladenine glycosylase I [Coriobacteriales bacterium]|jgi:DNA-3-methyladenine glycosylase I|nr:DNA-3-methyladenine glycosylase I [Coriobacteriales bacterium]